MFFSGLEQGDGFWEVGPGGEVPLSPGQIEGPRCPHSQPQSVGVETRERACCRESVFSFSRKVLTVPRAPVPTLCTSGPLAQSHRKPPGEVPRWSPFSPWENGHREVKQLAWGHTAGGGQGGDLNPTNLNPGALLIKLCSASHPGSPGGHRQSSTRQNTPEQPQYAHSVSHPSEPRSQAGELASPTAAGAWT